MFSIAEIAQKHTDALATRLRPVVLGDGDRQQVYETLVDAIDEAVRQAGYPVDAPLPLGFEELVNLILQEFGGPQGDESVYESAVRLLKSFSYGLDKLPKTETPDAPTE